MREAKDCTFCPSIIEAGEEALVWDGKPYCSMLCLRGGMDDAEERETRKR